MKQLPYRFQIPADLIDHLIAVHLTTHKQKQVQHLLTADSVRAADVEQLRASITSKDLIKKNCGNPRCPAFYLYKD